MKSLLNLVRRTQVAQPLKAPQLLPVADLKKVGGGLPRVGGLTGNCTVSPSGVTS
ncbi:MAG: hypothetical protein KGL18_00635 [Burkholderiales bacterium]|nr:hypothetical protein [Burkholderiales bacterium]MDE1926300.1 hypothetical protein [Burkholderiales bacterium]MDE2159349.1 hypothetical protein [Burkholderiales bacterium]MDE2501468.1 hypothetical protein [Burkholderiales bacterium]